LRAFARGRPDQDRKNQALGSSGY